MCAKYSPCPVSHLSHRLKSLVLDTQNFKSYPHCQKCMIRHLNTHLSQKKKPGSTYALIVCNLTGLILKKKMPFMNTLVIVGMQFYILLLKLFRICTESELWSSLLNSLQCMDINYESHFDSGTWEEVKNTTKWNNSPNQNITDFKDTYPATYSELVII